MSEYNKQNFVSGQVLKAEHLNNMEDGIVALSEEIADVDYGISFTMQNNKVSHSASFDDVAKVCLNDTRRANALLNIIYSLDMTAMQLTVSAHRSVWFKAVRDLTTNSIVAMQWGFIVDGAEVVYQFNPDGTVTEVTE